MRAFVFVGLLISAGMTTAFSGLPTGPALLAQAAPAIEAPATPPVAAASAR